MKALIRRVPTPVRLTILLAGLAGSLVFLFMKPEEQFVMEGRFMMTAQPSGDRCPVVAPAARQWTFTLPAEADEGQRVAQGALGPIQCKSECLVGHALDVRVIEWKSRAGFFSGLSEVVFDAELVRTGRGCRDTATVRGLISVDQGRRGDPGDVVNILGRWALEYYQRRYDELYGTAI